VGVGSGPGGRSGLGDAGQRRLLLIVGVLALAAFGIALAIGAATRAQSATPSHSVAAVSEKPTPLRVVGVVAIQAPPALKLQPKPKPPPKRKPKKRRAGTAKPAVKPAASNTSSTTTTSSTSQTTTSSSSQTTTSSGGQSTTSGGGQTTTSAGSGTGTVSGGG
jgi:outer membrane biosynthesis protein TonB